MKKTVATIKTAKGETFTLEGDSIICFTVSDAEEYLMKKVPCVTACAAAAGREIPDAVFANTLGALITSYVRKYKKDCSGMAAFTIHQVITALEASERALNDGYTINEKPDKLDEEFKNDEFFRFIRNLLRGV